VTVRIEDIARAVTDWFLRPVEGSAGSPAGRDALGPDAREPRGPYAHGELRARRMREPRDRREPRARHAHTSTAAATRSSRRPLPSSIALLAGGRGARGHGAAVALASAPGSEIALVAYWGCGSSEGATGAPALPTARRLAASLRARDLTARACGRLVIVTLAADESTAIGELRRAELAAGSADVPCTLVLAAARGAGWDPVLADRDVVLLHGCEDLVAQLALERLSDGGASAARLDPPPGFAVRTMSTAGLSVPGVLRPLRTVLREAA
jgi:hypothetical protein